MNQQSKQKQQYEIPKQWFPEVIDMYEPIRELGRGRFGIVILAKKKKKRIDNNNNNQHDNNNDTVVVQHVTKYEENDNDNEDIYHSIKVIGSKYATLQEKGYAYREIEILLELNHINIMKLYHSWIPKTENSSCVAIIAISYHNGPTLEYILNYGGKLSIICCRIISAQLINAISYLHNRACVHRDIKPDNIIISCIDPYNDNEIWDDNHIRQHNNHNNNHNDNNNDTIKSTSDEYDIETLISYRKKWHVTLIDFGLARALTPNDIKKKPPEFTPSDKTTLDIISQSTIISKSNNNKISISSKSRHYQRSMSAVGNHIYAAPEIIMGIHHSQQSNQNNEYNDIDVSWNSTGSSSRNRRKNNSKRNTMMIPNGSTSYHPIDITKTLSEHVSFYGLMADAYSIGNTMKYMLTGVSPNENVNDIIAFQNTPISILFNTISQLNCCCNNNNSKRQQLTEEEEDAQQQHKPPRSRRIRKMKYRKISDIPIEIYHFIKELTLYDPQKRMTVTMARQHPWIHQVLSDYDNNNNINNTNQIDYISEAIKRRNKAKQSKTSK